MKQLTARTACAVGAIAVSMAVFGTGTAAADAYAGKICRRVEGIE